MRKFFVLVVFFISVPAFFFGELYSSRSHASYYADKFHGRMTANGEIFDMNAYTAAHKTLPFNTVLRVTNLANGKSVTVRVNDRGPFVKGREIDLSRAAAEKIGMINSGVAEVSIEIIKNGNGERKSSAGKSASAPVNKASAAYWNIQVGSFSERKNAERCAGKIRSLGFSTIYERAGAVIRVIIPNMPASQLDSTGKKLKDNGFADYIARRAE